jgi:AcrR family transcriptional regulator
MDRALRVFSERGFHGASMNDVAEAAGVTKPVLYQHFLSKRDLYLELRRDVGLQLTEAITAATRAEVDVRAKTVAGLTAYFRFVQQEQAAFKLLFGSEAQPADGVERSSRQVEDNIADTIAGLLDPELGHEQRLVIAHGIVGMAEGTCRMWLRRHLDLDPDELGRQVGSLLYGGLRDLQP